MSGELVRFVFDGRYRLILRSNKPDADSFQDWICREVLPQSAFDHPPPLAAGGTGPLTKAPGTGRKFASYRDERLGRGYQQAAIEASPQRKEAVCPP